MRRTLGERLRLSRQAAGLRQADLGQQTNYDRSSIGHIEAGRQPVGAAFWQRADAVLGAGGVLLAAFHELAAAEAAADQAAAAARRAAAAQQLALLAGPAGPSAAETVDGSDARPVGEPATDASPATATLRWLVAPSVSSLARTGSGRRVGQPDVTRLVAVRAELKAMDDSLGGGAAYGMAHDSVRQQAMPLLDGSYSDAVGRDLYGVVAQLMLDLGWMAYDAGQQVVARRHMLRALELARMGHQQLFGGRVLSALSHQALHLGRVDEAVDLVMAAMAGTKQLAPPAAVAMFAAMLACALAAQGDRSSCEAALGQAERALSQVTDGDDVPVWLDFDEGGLAGHAARAYRDLAVPTVAQRFAETAVARCRAGHSRTRAQRTAILASVMVQSGELDQAAQVGEQVVADAWQLRSTHVVSDVAQLVQVIDPSQSASTFRFVRAARQLLAVQPAGSVFMR